MKAVSGARRRDARLIVLQVLVVSLVATLFMRLAWMQTANGATYRQAASTGTVREVVVPAQRGLILDQVGRPLVANKSSIVVSVDRDVLNRQRDGGKAMLARLATELGTTADALTARMRPCGTKNALPQPLCWNGPATQPVVVAENVDTSVGLQLMEQTDELKGVHTQLQAVRSYPKTYGASLTHVAGYLGPMTQDEIKKSGHDLVGIDEQVGRAGLEAQYNSVLAGHAGVQKVALTRAGGVSTVLSDTPAVVGSNLVTSIDARLQGVVEQQLQQAITRSKKAGNKADSGSIIVMEPSTGRILAMASWPTYDPQIWVGGISSHDYKALTDPKQGTPLLNRAIQGLYAPASTFKAITTAAAVRAGYSTSGSYECPSTYNVGGQIFNNYESEAFGSISLAKALAVSCDTVFYKLAHQMWLKDGGLNPKGEPNEFVVNEAKSFGLGQETGIDLPDESKGKVVSRATKQTDYAELKDVYCKRAKDGYPELADQERAKLLQSYASDYCAEGASYRAGDALNTAIGQGDTQVTPLQMLTAYSAIANGGSLMQPQIAKAVVSADGAVTREFDPVKNGEVKASAATLDYLRSALSDTVVSGTAHNAFLGFPHSEVSVALKTGTAEVVGKGSTAWIESFAPSQNAKFAVGCTISQGGTGAEACGPSVRAIYEALFGVKDGHASSDRSILSGGDVSSKIPTETVGQN